MKTLRQLSGIYVNITITFQCQHVQNRAQNLPPPNLFSLLLLYLSKWYIHPFSCPNQKTSLEDGANTLFSLSLTPISNHSPSLSTPLYYFSNLSTSLLYSAIFFWSRQPSALVWIMTKVLNSLAAIHPTDPQYILKTVARIIFLKCKSGLIVAILQFNPFTHTAPLFPWIFMGPHHREQ